MGSWQAKAIVAAAFTGNMLMLAGILWKAFSGEVFPATQPHVISADFALIFTALFGVNSLLCWSAFVRLCREPSQ